MFLETIFTDVKKTVQSITVKLDGVAKTMESLDTRRDSDQYISASLRSDTFNSYPSFPKEVLEKVVTDVVMVGLYADDKSLIPDNLKDMILEEQRKYILSTYVEKNNYYRKLAGLPDLEDTNFVYITDDMAQTHEIDKSIPVHQLPEELVLKLQKSGDFNELQLAYPDKKYLQYVGSNKIDITVARQAKNFALLRLPNDVSESFYEDFSDTYDECRTYFMTVLYNREFGSRFDLYDNYMAMMILVMTIQRLFVNSFKYGIERDFYDLSTIRMLFDSYNVPFMENLPIELQRILVRNLNTLLHYKSTDKVLYDICSLLGFERINIYKYYLVKEHKLDENENPLFIFKEEVDERTGEVTLVEDVEKMYNLYFQAVELRERNIALSLSNNVGKMDYNQVVSNDVFWWDEDDTLKQQLYTSEFNYVESKYINMNIMYKLTEMLFEIIYVFRMMVDKADSTSNVYITLPRLFQQKEISLFHITVILMALVSKKNGFAGNIIHTPSKTLAILGFNFEADFTSIREEIRKNPKLYDQKILQYIQNMDVYSANDINALYRNIRELAEFLVDRMGSTRNRKRYQAYKKLYDTLMITDNVSTMFTKKNGDVANTFLEFLDDYDLTVGEFVRTADVSAIPEFIEHILFRLNGALKDLKHLYIFNDSNNVTMEAIISLIRFFKSYTTDLNSFNILYLMDSRYFNMIKMLGEINYLKKTLGLKTNNLRSQYKDTSRTLIKLLRKQKANLSESASMSGTQRREERMKRKHSRKISKVIQANRQQKLLDIVAMKAGILNREHASFEEKMTYTAAIHRREKPQYRDKYGIQQKLYRSENAKPFDIQHYNDARVYQDESNVIRQHSHQIDTNYRLNEHVINYDKRRLYKILKSDSRLLPYDIVNGISNTMIADESLIESMDVQAFKDIVIPSDKVTIKLLESLVTTIEEHDKVINYLDIVTNIETHYQIGTDIDLTKVGLQAVTEVDHKHYQPVYEKMSRGIRYDTSHPIGEFLHTFDIPETTLYPDERTVTTDNAQITKDYHGRTVQTSKDKHGATNKTLDNKTIVERSTHVNYEALFEQTAQIKSNTQVQHSKEIVTDSLAKVKESPHVHALLQESMYSTVSDILSNIANALVADKVAVSDNIKLTWEE